MQSRINGELGRELGDGYLAAFLSFGSGLIILSITALGHPATKRGVATIIRSIREGSIPWWYLAGGTAGALFVLAQGLTAALLGVALFTVATVTGQTLSGLLVDRRGVGTMAPKPITAFRLVGAGLAVLAVGFAVSPQIQLGVAPWVLILPLAAGLGLGWQQAVNGQLRELAKSALTATFFNFAFGTAVLAIILLVHGLISGLPQQLAGSPWLYVGGAIGIIFVAGYAIVVRITGVLLLGLGAIAGQLAASLAFDLALPVADHPIAWQTIVGTIATFVAIAVAAIPVRATSGAPRS
ncbi:MAG: DMT family transporter [Salinibacterium sp.]|nr:DMT family transporter [Salinibacterium sp.]